jgi:hypothetical protein
LVFPAKPFTRPFLVLAAILLLINSGFAQELTNVRSKRIQVSSQRTYLDSLSIIEGSALVQMDWAIIDTSLYHIDYLRSALIWKGEYPADSIDITYKVYPVNFLQVFRRRSEDMIQPEDQYQYKPFTFRPQAEEASVFGSTELNKTGSISRGIGFGNSQNLSVNSTLSLQLSGKLNDDISILASVTDDNIPIQPDGSTAQLQEFDRVFIQLYNDKSKLTAGDFFIYKPTGYFTNYFKRAQGINFETRQKLGDNHTFFTQTSAAVSRGKFARNIIQGQEGNQGPYRLRGNENELFIIILAGTERVFIDGVEMKRGQENDYIIDYNTSEITFTARQLINKDKRIAVDFQYSDAQYSRSMLQTSTGVETEKYTAYINVFSEQDAKNQPLQQDLTDADRQILADAGNDVSQAFAPSYSQVPFNNEQVLYYITDSLGYDSVFVRTLTERPQVYQVTFSNVGQGNGDYIQDGFDATGRVYKWIAPAIVDGIFTRQGQFAPVRRLSAPKKNQMIVGGVNYRFSERTAAEVEAGFSNSDRNTFSDLDDQDNISHGILAKISHLQPLSDKVNAFALKGAVTFESIGNNFQPIEPYRSVEFYRDWNLTEDLQQRYQNILSGGMSLLKDRHLDLTYQLYKFDAGGVYSATKNVLNADVDYNGLDVWFRGSLLSTDGIEESEFMRHRSRVEKDLWVTKIGFEDEREDNRKLQPLSDSLSIASYRFYDWQFYLTNLDTAKIGYKVFYRERTDFATDINQLGQSTHASHYGVDFALEQNPRNQLKASLSSRTLNISNPELTEEAPERTLLMRLDHNLRLAKNVVTSNTYYELGAGLERRQEFLYIFDPTGQGPYTWIDHNDNGIKELNEFELARPEDGQRYVRIFTPTDDYISAYSNQFSQTLNINPAGAWMGKDGIKKVVARFSNQTAFRVQRKTTREEGADRFNPFVTGIGDSTLISQSSSIRNTVFFNRTSSKFGTDYTYSNNKSKSPLTNGFEERFQVAHNLRIRYNFNPAYGILLEQEMGKKQSGSDVIEGRNFDISYQSLKQVLSYQPGTTFRVSLSNQYTERVNSLDLGGETATLIDLGIELRANKIESGSVFGQVNYITIDYDAETNNSLAYEMLDGLQNGKNITWAAGVERTLGNNMQLSLSYNGRKSDEIKAVHTGNVQVRAFF